MPESVPVCLFCGRVNVSDPRGEARGAGEARTLFAVLPIARG